MLWSKANSKPPIFSPRSRWRTGAHEILSVLPLAGNYMLTIVSTLMLGASAYKCTLPDGSIAFQSTPCKTGVQEISGSLPLTEAEKQRQRRLDADEQRKFSEQQRVSDMQRRAREMNKVCASHGYGDDQKACVQGLVKPQFSLWDGSHRELERLIKAQMKNPASYEHVETNYYTEGGTVVVTCRYRGTNSFGAVVPSETVGRFTLEGKFLALDTK